MPLASCHRSSWPCFFSSTQSSRLGFTFQPFAGWPPGRRNSRAGRLRLAGPLFCPPSAGRPRVHHARRAKQGRPESYAWQVKPVCVHASKRTKYWCNLLPFSRRAALERGHQQFARFCCFNVGPLKRQAFWLAGWQPALFMLCAIRDDEISPQRLARNPSSVAPVCV